MFDQALGFFQDHFGHLDVALGGLIEGRADDLALYGSLHVRDFFRALIDQQHDQGDFRMIGGDGVGHRLQHHGFAGTRRGHDQTALALADRAEQIENTAGKVLFGRLHFQPALRIERSKIVEKDFIPRYLGILEVNGLHLNQREVALAVLGRTHLSGDGIAGAQVEFANLRGRDIDIVGAGQVVVFGRAQEAEAIRQAFQDAFAKDEAVFLGLRTQDLEDQLLFAHSAGAGDGQVLGDFGQIGDVFVLQFCKANTHCDHSLTLTGAGIPPAPYVGKFSAGGGITRCAVIRRNQSQITEQCFFF